MHSLAITPTALSQKHFYNGTFEAHITISVATLATQEKFCQLCSQLNIKYILIELPDGVTRSQLMTASHHRGEFPAVLTDVQALAQQLISGGFEVTRIKVEALVNNQGVPESDDEAQALPASNYFEFHVKATLPANADIEALRVCCQEQDAHLSTNAFKYQSDGQQQRFITMRVYGVGRRSAEARFDALLEWLKAKKLKLSNQLREYTVYDSNIALDEGWGNKLSQGEKDEHHL